MDISRSVLAAIRAEAATSLTHEICGILTGDGTRIDAAHLTRNVSTDPAIRFEIDPQALIAALRSEREGGAQVMGYYHSHPGGDPVPSPTDAAMAAPDGRLWLIVAGDAVRAWRAVGDGSLHSRFDPVAIIAVP